MANLFLNIPVPAANGAGASVDVSAMGKTKSFVCGGGFKATVNVEYSTDAGGVVWAPLATFQQSGNLTIDVAAHWLRAVTQDYKGGAPNLDVGSNDSGTLFALLPAAGTPVDISTLPLFKTVVVPGGVSAIIEVSEDGVSWAQIFSLPNGGAQSRPVYGQFARSVSGADVTIAAANEGGAGVGGAGILSLYGDGSFGDHVTAGDETWTSLGVPGAPAVPLGTTELPFAFFDNLTISPGDSVTVGGLTGEEVAERAIVVFVRENLTIGAGGRINVNGEAGATGSSTLGNSGGRGREATINSQSGTDGGRGGFSGAPLLDPNGLPGGDGGDRPALSNATMIGGTGGNSGPVGIEPVALGGIGGVCLGNPSWPYSLSQALSVAALLVSIGGGLGGGGGGGSGAGGFGGGGGGGAGTLIIFAKNIVAPAGSLQAIGGAGGAGVGPAGSAGAGGAGGTGGTILVVTENVTLLGLTNAAGGAGGIGAGVPTNPGTAGGPGAVIGINPTLAMQIPT